VAVAALLAVAPAYAQSLSDTVRTAVQTSPRVESMIHNRESVDAEMRRAKGLYLPQLDVRSAIGPEYTENVLTQGTNGQHMRSELGAVLAQKLYDGGAVAGQVDHERGRSKSAAYRIRENAEFTGLDAVEAHLDVVRFRHVFQYAQDNVKAHQDLLDRVQRRSTGGAGRAADVAQAQSRLDLATATRDETRGMLEDAEARYLSVVGVAPAALEDAGVPTGAINNDINAELAQLQAQNPTVKAREADIEAAQGLVEQADARFDPTISAEVSGDKNRNVGGFPGRDNEARALLVLRWNLYAGGADIANRQSAYAQVAQAKTDRLQALRDAEQNLRQSQSAFNAAMRLCRARWHIRSRCATLTTSNTRLASAPCSICSTRRTKSSRRRRAWRRRKGRRPSMLIASWRSRGCCSAASTFRRRRPPIRTARRVSRRGRRADLFVLLKPAVR
jgi:adhesin transport system outer membrane protein